MPYRLRYTFNVDWVPAGTGSTQPNANDSVNGCSGGAQTKGFINTPGGSIVLGSGTAGAFNATDVTNLASAMSTDVTAQLTGAIAQLAGFNSGGG